MELKNIDKKTYLTFALKNPYISIYQLPEWGTLKETNGWKSHLVGLYEDNTLKGVTLLLEKPTPIKKSLFYAPRGFLLDYNDTNLFQEFTKKVAMYVKKNHGFLLKCDPNVIYAIRDANGENKKVLNEELYQEFMHLGYKHLGFTKNFETLQPRNLCRFALKDTYEETLLSFSKNTRKNIEKYVHMGVDIRVIEPDEVDLFVSLLQETADKKHFVIRPVSYYKKMYELMRDYLKYYIVYIDPDKYYEFVSMEVKKAKEDLAKLDAEMKRINIGDKIRKKRLEYENKVKKLEDKLIEAKKIKDSGVPINIGALMSVFVGDEGITFMSGTSNLYKEFGPKYVFYNEHIKECLKQKKKYCNFYGISLNLNPNNPYYSIYEIKKGFNPEIVELLGEFDYIVNSFFYYLYKIALKVYKIFK